MDDIFLLCAALSSGKNSYVLSNDSMEEHKIAIGREFYDSFKLWHEEHWYRCQIGENNSLQLVKHKKKFSHKVGDFWHLPFLTAGKIDTTTWNSHFLPQNWACIRMASINSDHTDINKNCSPGNYIGRASKLCNKEIQSST